MVVERLVGDLIYRASTESLRKRPTGQLKTRPMENIVFPTCQNGSFLESGESQHEEVECLIDRARVAAPKAEGLSGLYAKTSKHAPPFQIAHLLRSSTHLSLRKLRDLIAEPHRGLPRIKRKVL
jgi:hypothetical protein